MSDRETLEKLAHFWEQHGGQHPTAPGIIKERAAAIRGVLAEVERLKADLSDHKDAITQRDDEMARLHNALEDRIDAALAPAKAIAEWDQEEHPEVCKDEFAYDRMVESFKEAGRATVKALEGKP